MTQAQRTIAFLCAMFLTFGINGIDIKNFEYVDNTKELVSIGIGLVLLVVWVVLKLRR